MAKTNPPPLSASAADNLLRQRLREPIVAQADLPGGSGAAETGLIPPESLQSPITHHNSTPADTHGLGPKLTEQVFPSSGGADELDRLRRENNELQKLIEELRLIFSQATEQEAENARFIEQLQKQVGEAQAHLLEKEEQLALFQSQIHELEQHIQQAAPPPPSEDELSKMADELEKERVQLARDRKELEAEREQLRDDEQDMMKQMREMEVQMAKERAEMARQRTELQRLHGEIERELGQMQGNDRVVADRLVQFQRRHQELVNKSGAPAPSPPPPPPSSHAGLPAQRVPNAVAPGKRDSGLLSRIFNRK